MAGRRSLEEKVLEAFEQALEEGRMDVAEHLLRTLGAFGHAVDIAPGHLFLAADG
jgi:hypothetical protein